MAIGKNRNLELIQSDTHCHEREVPNMPNLHLSIALLALLLPTQANAQLFKCKTPSGGTVVSDTPCQGSNKTVDVRQFEEVPQERQLQAAELQSKQSQQLRRLEAEEATVREQRRLSRQADDALQARQQADAATSKRNSEVISECVRDVERRGASPSTKANLIAACQSAPITQQARQTDDDSVKECVQSVERQGGSETVKARAIARCHGGDVQPTYRPRAPVPTTITNCDPSGCWDNLGNRYNRNGSSGFTRNDGKLCQQVGTQLNCH